MQPQSIDLKTAVSETAAISSRIRTDPSLFMAHLSIVQPTGPDRQAAAKASRESSDSDDDANDTKKSKSSHRHTASQSKTDSSTSSANDTQAATSDASLLPDIMSLATLPLVPPTGAGDASTPHQGDTTETNGTAENASAAAGTGASTAQPASDAQAAASTGNTASSAGQNNAAVLTAATPLSTPQSETAQAQVAANTQKPINFVRPVGTTSASSASGPSPNNAPQTGSASTAPVNVVVQPKPPTVTPPSAPSSAHLAQEAAEPAPANDQGTPQSAGSSSQPVEATKAGSGLIVSTAASGGTEIGHGNAFDTDSDGKGDILKDETATPAAASASAAAGDNAFASMVSGSMAASSAAPTQTAAAPPSTTPTTSAQVPLPPVEQLITGLSQLSDKANSFSMQLDPERLGAVSVQLDIDAKGKARATFSAERPETLALLRQDSHQLVKALQQAGVNTDASSLNFSLKDQNGGGQAQDRRFSPGSGANSRNTSASVETDAGSVADVRDTVSSSRLYDLSA